MVAFLFSGLSAIVVGDGESPVVSEALAKLGGEAGWGSRIAKWDASQELIIDWFLKVS